MPPDQKGIDVLACLGDAEHPDTWSSTPHHLLQAGRARGILREGLKLDPGALRRRRIGWNLLRALSGSGYGGYQFSVDFQEHLWAAQRPMLRGRSVLNQFQLFPPSIVGDESILKAFYIDGTLKQLFEYNRHPSGWRVKREAIERERAGYHAAQAIVTMSRFAADSVIGDYGIHPEKVHVVVPGANFDAEAYERWYAAADPNPPTDRPLRLLFVGKYWKRKGLDRLLRGLVLARARGLDATLRVIGCDSTDLPRTLRGVKGVDWCGYISRNSEAERLFNLMAQCDVGCLLSRQEFSAIALREYLALGLVVAGPDTGGCRDLMVEGGSISIPPAASDEDVADALMRLRDPTAFERMRQVAWEHRRSATWETSVAQLERILSALPPAGGPA